jgi:hypothetical protein
MKCPYKYSAQIVEIFITIVSIIILNYINNMYITIYLTRTRYFMNDQNHIFMNNDQNHIFMNNEQNHIFMNNEQNHIFMNIY